MKQLELFPKEDDRCEICGQPLSLDRIYAYCTICEDCEAKGLTEDSSGAYNYNEDENER